MRVSLGNTQIPTNNMIIVIGDTLLIPKDDSPFSDSIVLY